MFLGLRYNSANWKLVIIFRSLPHYQCKFRVSISCEGAQIFRESVLTIFALHERTG